MNIPFYFFSNTLKEDFHEIIVPQNLTDRKNCRRLLESRDITDISDAEFAVFAKTVDSKNYVGVLFNVSVLEDISSRFFNVARCSGKTPTQVAALFVLPIGLRLFVNKNMLAKLVRSVFTKKVWNSVNVPVVYGSVNIPTVDLSLKRMSVKKKFHCVDDVLAKFNSVMANSNMKKINMVYSYVKDKDQRRLAHLYDNVEVSIDLGKGTSSGF